MKRICWRVAGLVIALSLTRAATAQTVDNPQYQQWATWREGASITIKTESKLDGQVQVVAKTTQTLKKLSADTAVIETMTVTEAGGQTIKTGPISMEIPARVPKQAFKPADDSKPEEGPKVKETKGRETLKVNGKELKCEWIQYEVEGMGLTKTWSCAEVPFGFVKSESGFQGNTTTVQILEWKATKK